MDMSKFFLSILLVVAFAVPGVFAVEDPPTNPGDRIPSLPGAISSWVALEGISKSRLAVANEGLQDIFEQVGDECPQFNNETCPAPELGFQTFDYTQSLEQIMSLSIPTGENQSNRSHLCNCLRSKVNPQPLELSQLKTQLKSKLRSQVNKKLLNDFSSHLEDIHYFYFASKNFRKNILTDSSDFSVQGEVLCTSESIYKKAFRKNEKCKAKNLNESDMEKQIANVFGALGMTVDDGLQTTINLLKDDVLMKDKRNFNCSSGVYSRFCHDRQRSSISKSPAGKNADRFLTKVLKSSTYRTAISTYAKNHQISPLSAMALVLTKDLKEQNADILKLVDREMLGSDLYQDLAAALKIKKVTPELQRKIFDRINKVISLGVETHPGLDRIVKDNELFERTGKNLNSALSVMAYLEEDMLKMNQHFEESCQKLAANVAETVCSSDDELLSSVGDKDFFEYIQFIGGKDERTKKLTGVIACENSGRSSSNLIDFVLNPELRKTSDYYDMKSNKDANLTNLYSKLEKERGNPNSAVSIALNNVNKDFGDSFFDFGDEGSDGDFFGTGSRNKIAASNLSNTSVDQVKEETSENSVFRNVISNMTPDNSPEALDTETGFYSNSTANNSAASSQTNTNSASETRIDPRQEFRDFLSEREDQEVVDELMSNTSDDMMKELMDLKEEMNRNQQRILELTAENERLKLDSMRKKMESLQNERAALEPGDPERVRQNSAFARRDSPLNSGIIGRNIPAATPVETGGVNSGSGTALTGQDSSGGASLSGLNRALLSSAGGGRSPASDSSANPVVVSASTARSGSLEIRSQEVGLDLLNYLSNNGSDIQTLINLKTSGIIYKYRVLENGQFVEKEVLIEYTNLNEDVKKIIDKKIAQNKDRSKEVLRLDNEIKELQRIYSYSALQMILADQMRGRTE